jgi:uncharacterized protein YaeQ
MSRSALTLAPHPTERQQRIDEIKRLLAEDGFVARDMFLTTELVQQMAAPDPVKNPDAHALWWQRENRRRQIFRFMSLYGLTAHDLARPHREGMP